MALGGSFAVMAILLAETLITLGASLQYLDKKLWWRCGVIVVAIGVVVCAVAQECCRVVGE